MNPDSNSEKISRIMLADLASGELLRLWKSGDERAASTLMDRYAVRLVALVASRMNRRFRDTLDPEDVVQSAMGSFFGAAQQSRIHISDSVSLWRILATFTRRKLSRAIEKQDTAKRGAHLDRVSLEAAEQAVLAGSLAPQDAEVRELMESLDSHVHSDLREVLHRLLAGFSHREIGESLNIDERTVRRRVVRIREVFAFGAVTSDPAPATEFSSATLPRIDYREFVLGKLIGAGGFGKVYRAVMQTDGSTVAVKFLRKSYWQSDSARQTFLREIESASQIDHRSVPRYLGWGKSPHGGPYVISRWIDGQTLDQLHSVDAKRFASYLRQLCEALTAIHDMGVVHGDITPSNILVDSEHQISITDFGFSRYPDATHRRNDELEPVLGGTVGFAAPEQISTAFGAIGPKTDLYAVGSLAYWYLAGIGPHDSERTDESIADTISPSAADTEKLIAGSKAAHSIKQVATTALRKAVADRPSSAAQLTEILQDCLDSDETT